METDGSNLGSKELIKMRMVGKVAWLCLVSMFAMGMALAGSASAAPLWLLCLEANEKKLPLNISLTSASKLPAATMENGN